MVWFHQNHNQESTCSTVALRDKGRVHSLSQPLGIFCTLKSFVKLNKTKPHAGSDINGSLFSLSCRNVSATPEAVTWNAASYLPRCNWTSFTSKVLDLRWRASWQAAVTTLSIKSSAICRSIWKRTKDDSIWKTTTCVQQRKIQQPGAAPYLQPRSLLVMQPPDFQLNKMSEWWMWQQVGALEGQQRDSWDKTNFKDFASSTQNHIKGKTGFRCATKTADIPLQHPRPVAHLDRSPSPSPAASFYWEPEKKADASICYFMHLAFPAWKVITNDWTNWLCLAIHLFIQYKHWIITYQTLLKLWFPRKL